VLSEIFLATYGNDAQRDTAADPLAASAKSDPGGVSFPFGWEPHATTHLKFFVNAQPQAFESAVDSSASDRRLTQAYSGTPRRREGEAGEGAVLSQAWWRPQRDQTRSPENVKVRNRRVSSTYALNRYVIRNGFKKVLTYPLSRRRAGHNPPRFSV
jgi:hypothetical protein